IVGLTVIVWVTSFEWLERIFGYGGLCLLVFAVAAVKLGPDWGKVGNGFIPHVAQNNKLLYAYFAIGLLGAAMTPYEVYFYSSGGVEEEWTPKDIGLNRANAIIRSGGLCLLVFAVAAVKLGPDWGKVGNGFIPHVAQNNKLLYAYFAIGLLGAAMTPYEVYFYSSGGVEEEWTPKDIGLNRANAII